VKKYAVIAPADRFGLSREEASEYVGVGHTLFDAMVADGRMPKPYLINTRRVWARLELETAFVKLPKDEEGAVHSDPWAASVA
jgi:predicted DNA-binding transcriptional regulator AlpA